MLECLDNLSWLESVPEHAAWFGAGIRHGCMLEKVKLAMQEALCCGGPEFEMANKRLEELSLLTEAVKSGRYGKTELANVLLYIEESKRFILLEGEKQLSFAGTECKEELCCRREMSESPQVAWFAVGQEFGMAAEKMEDKCRFVCGKEWWELTQRLCALKSFARSVYYGNVKPEETDQTLTYLRAVVFGEGHAK